MKRCLKLRNHRIISFQAGAFNSELKDALETEETFDVKEVAKRILEVQIGRDGEKHVMGIN